MTYVRDTMSMTKPNLLIFSISGKIWFGGRLLYNSLTKHTSLELLYVGRLAMGLKSQRIPILLLTYMVKQPIQNTIKVTKHIET